MLPTTVDKLSEAIFSDPDACVVEAYSDFGVEPLIFKDTAGLSAFIQTKLAEPKGLAYFFVVYPDMGGTPRMKEIHLNPEKVDGHTKRFTWDGWGLISVQLHAPGSGASNINANSEKRAAKWTGTHPELGPPGVWNWPAVERHKRRLQRVLKSAA
jgi:hypothetical protein